MKIKIITDAPSKEFAGISRYEKSILPIIKDKIKVEIVPITSLKRPNFFLRALNLMRTLLDKKFNDPYKRSNTELIHFTNQQLALLLNFIEIKSKVLVTVHDIIPFVPPYSSQYSLFDRLRYKLVINGVKKADKIITVSNYTKDELIDHLGIPPDKIYVVCEGVDHNMYYLLPRDEEVFERYNIPKKGKIILSVGSEQPRKNFPVLFEAFALLKKMMEDVYFVKVGLPQWPGARKKNMELIDELGLQDSVIFTGYVPEEDLPKLYSVADLFVFPTLSEGFGLPVLEAMACGCPVITSDIPPLNENVADGGLLVNPSDSSKLAEAMYKILSDISVKEDLIRRAMERAKTFRWEQTAEETIKVYNSDWG